MFVPIEKRHIHPWLLACGWKTIKKVTEEFPRPVTRYTHARLEKGISKVAQDAAECEMYHQSKVKGLVP